MISSKDSSSDSDDSLLIHSSSSSDTDDEIDLTKSTAAPTVNRDPFQFVRNREVRVGAAQTPVEFWNYIFPKNLVQVIVRETNWYAENIYHNPQQRRSPVNQWEPTNIEKFNVFIALLILQGIIKKNGT